MHDNHRANILHLGGGLVRLATIVPGVVGCLLTTLAWGQSKPSMTIVDLIDVPRLRDPQLSPDGRQLLYLLAEAN